MTEILEVTEWDTTRLIEQVRAGSLQPSAEMFRLYVRLMESDRRSVATRNALGRALTAAGCTRQRVVRNGAQIHAWRIPGYPTAALEKDFEEVKAVHRELGGGIHPHTLIYETYQRLARERKWGDNLLDWSGLMSVMTRLNYPRMVEKGQPSRYFSPNTGEELVD